MGLIDECGWYESDCGRLLGLVLLDRVDGDYQGAILGRDLKERFRWVEGTDFFPDPEAATAAMRAKAPEVLANLERERIQGDEHGPAVDFFAPAVPKERLDPAFAELREGEGFSAARELLTSLMRWHEDIDGNFVAQFQTTGFDARILELYVFALLVENGFSLSREHAAPDFDGRDSIGPIAIEVTSANPTRDAAGNVVPPPKPETAEERLAYLKKYMPIKFGSALTSKLRKRYWTLEHVAGKPFAIAIQDFHAPNSMGRARTGLSIYLYGMDHDWHYDADGTLVIEPREVTEHRWGDKVIPSGFFRQPESEHVSAVLFNSSATLPKFNRLGHLAGFGSRRVKMIRVGTALNPDPNAAEPLRFVHDLDDPDYDESWSEGLDVFHNPNARIPLKAEHFPTASHHYLQPDGQVRTTRLVEVFHPLGSVTQVLIPNDEAE